MKKPLRERLGLDRPASGRVKCIQALSRGSYRFLTKHRSVTSDTHRIAEIWKSSNDIE
jgi:hypothetical protein